MQTLDLFAPREQLSGLRFMEDLLTEAEEAALLRQLATVPVEPFRFQGWVGKRLTASYGWHYDFDDAKFGPADPIPDWLIPSRAACGAFAGIDPERLVHVLVTRYDRGAGIGWHRDRPVFDEVVGVSLGAAAALRFRRRTDTGFLRRTLPLPPRSAYHLSGDARFQWEHSIAAIPSTRWSITFRTLSERIGLTR